MQARMLSAGIFISKNGHLRHLPPQQDAPYVSIDSLAIVLPTQADAFDSQALAAINAYNPGLSGAWMLQRAMSLRVGQKQVAVVDGCSSAWGTQPQKRYPFAVI